MVRPSAQFCCGCTLTFCAYVIVVCNLVFNLVTIATVTSNVILKIPTFGYNSGLVTQTINACVCMIGLPFIFGALWGLVHKLEPNLRLYLCYLIFAFIVDMCYIIDFVVLEDTCENLPSALQRHGAAFACGFMRIGTVVIILTVLVLETYCMYTIWSL